MKKINKKLAKQLAEQGVSQRMIEFAREISKKAGEDFTEIRKSDANGDLVVMFGEPETDKFMKLTLSNDGRHCFYQILSDTSKGIVSLGTCSVEDADNLVKEYKHLYSY